MHYNELQFSPLESCGNCYSLCLVVPDPEEPAEPLVGAQADRAVCLVAIAGGIVYALRFVELDNRRRRSPLVVSKYILLDFKSFHAKHKLFDELIAVNVEICAIDSLQSDGKTYVGLTYSKTAVKTGNTESVAYGFSLFELVRSVESKKLALNHLFKHNMAYIPSILTHTKIYRLHENKLEDVFACFCFEKFRHEKGCDLEVFSLNQTDEEKYEKENLRVQYFPEIEQQVKNVLHARFELANANTVRLSAWGTDTGGLRVAVLDLHSLDVLATCSLEYDVSILNCQFLWPLPASSSFASPADRVWNDPGLGLLVAAITEPVVVFTELFSSSAAAQQQQQPSRFSPSSATRPSGSAHAGGSSSSGQPRHQLELPDTRQLDCPAFLAILDVDEDGEEEIVVGSFCQRIRVYKRSCRRRDDNEESDGDVQLEFSLTFERLFNSPVQCIAHADVTGDGVRELLVLTVNGLHVLQRCRSDIDAKLRHHLERLGLFLPAQDKQQQHQKPKPDNNASSDATEAAACNDEKSTR